MTTTPRLGAPLLVSGQAAPETTVNGQAVLWDAFCMAHFINRTTATPPGSPAQGDCYLIASSPTGAWTGQTGKIAVYINTSWTFVAPQEGFVFWVDAEGILLIYHSSAWFTVGLSGGTFLQAANNLSDVASASTSRTNLGLGTAATAALDTDVTLAANSDTSIASQKAIKTYIANKLIGMFDLRGTTDCSASPNYPAAVKGDAYAVTVAGKIGGSSGVSVAIGDVYFATADNAGGTQAAVGASWDKLANASVAAGGGMLAANNLSDVASPVAAKDNISVKGTDIASATTTNLASATGDYINVTGTTTITGLGTAAAGVERTVTFTGILTLTYNATSLILPGAANITTAAGDTAVFRSLGSGNWKCVDFARASGQAIAAGSITYATQAEARAGTVSNKPVAPDVLWSEADVVTLTDAATVALDMATFVNGTVTLAGNRTLGNPSNTKNGQSGLIEIKQDATGSRTLAYSSNWKFAGGIAPTLTTTASARDLLFYQVISSTVIYGTLVKDVK